MSARLTGGDPLRERHAPHASYRRDIDGLRAIAIVPVILFHARVDAFSGGFLGVDVFFVVSGFLITSLINTEIAHGRFSYLSFWERRARRLLPAMFLVIAATAFVAYWMLVPGELEAFARSVVSTVFFSSNVYFWLNTGYFDTATPTAPLLHMWSLAVEEQFYLLFPAVLAAAYWVKRIHPVTIVIVIGAASFAVSVWWVSAYPHAAYYLLPSRAWELMLGAALALLRPSRPVSLPPLQVDAAIALGLSLILIPVFLYDANTPFPGFAALVPCIGAGLVIWFGDQRSRVGRLLDNRPMVVVGQLSYSLYLWHWPIIVFASMLRGSTSFTAVETLGIAAATFVCSWLSYVLVENPIRRRTFLPTRRLLFSMVGVASASLAVFGLVAVVERGLQYRMPESALRIAKAAEDRAPDWERCDQGFDRQATPQDLCRLGPKNGSTPRFLLWGDSHALALFPAVDAAAKETGVVGLHASLYQCPPIPGIDIDSPWDIDCSGFNRRISDLIDSEPFDAIILAAHWTMYFKTKRVHVPAGSDDKTPGEFLGSQLAASIERLSSRGITVFVVNEVPYTKHFRPEQAARADWWGLGVDEPAISVKDYETRQQIFRAALEGSRFIEISPVEYLCVDGSFCPALMDGWSNYVDANHLSVRGATRLTPAFVDVLQHIGLESPQVTPASAPAKEERQVPVARGGYPCDQCSSSHAIASSSTANHRN